MDDKSEPERWRNALSHAENELDRAAADWTEQGRLRRVQLHDSLADYFYGMRDIFRDQGNHEAAEDARRRGDAHWGQVMAESGTDDSPLTPEQAAKLLTRQRGGI